MRQVAIILLTLLIACGQKAIKSSDSETTQLRESPLTVTSIVRLIATPDKFEGRQIMVEGFMNVEFEGNAIYLHKDDYENGLYSNGLWISLTEDQEKEIDSLNLNKSYVLLEGTFNSDGHGHLGLWSGEIINITEIKRQQGGPPPIREIIKFSPPKVRDK